MTGVASLGLDRRGRRRQVGPSTCAISARIRVKLASVASAETLLSSQRGHRRTSAATEERPDHFGALCTNTSRKVCGPEPCGKSYLEASPYVRYVSVLGPDCSCEALQHQSAHPVGERQLTLQDLAVEAA